MWQVILAAAVAGSTGLLAKHLFSPNSDLATIPIAGKTEDSDDHYKGLENPGDNSQSQSPLVPNGLGESGYESNCEKQDGIFRFSSSGSTGKTGFISGSKKLRKKVAIGCGGSGENEDGLKGGGWAEKIEKRSGGVEQRKSGRRFAVCLKRRKTAKNVAANCGPCSSKDSSLFGWGLGVGIMCMVSTGKAEISKLNTTMDETAKVVQELKSELYRRKSFCNLQVSSSATELAANSKKNRSSQTQLVLSKSGMGNSDCNSAKVSSLPMIDDGEYASSVLTEEPEPEVLEMDQLEAELEFELQKLPWCTKEASHHEGMKSNIGETEASDKRFYELERHSSDSYQCHGVMPSELDQKLCHLLIEQQDNKIVELECELHMAQSKLNEKEAELQALKGCVKRLTEFSLSTVSDEETEAQEEQQCTSGWDYHTGSDSRKSVVGMKRPVDFDSESCRVIM